MLFYMPLLLTAAFLIASRQWLSSSIENNQAGLGWLELSCSSIIGYLEQTNPKPEVRYIYSLLCVLSTHTCYMRCLRAFELGRAWSHYVAVSQGVQVRTMAMFVVLFRSVGRCRDADSVIVYWG